MLNIDTTKKFWKFDAMEYYELLQPGEFDLMESVFGWVIECDEDEVINKIIKHRTMDSFDNFDDWYKYKQEEELTEESLFE